MSELPYSKETSQVFLRHVIKALREEKEDERKCVKELAEALNDAVDTIHGEFCGDNYHHKQCSKFDEIIKKYEVIK